MKYDKIIFTIMIILTIIWSWVTHIQLQRIRDQKEEILRLRDNPPAVKNENIIDTNTHQPRNDTHSPTNKMIWKRGDMYVENLIKDMGLNVPAER